MKATIVIPAYEPDIRFISFLAKLKEQTDRNIIVIDDGSGLDYQGIFQQVNQLGCILLTHDKNLGKGVALKTAMAFQLRHFPESAGIVTADSDGQHQVTDILTIAQNIEQKTGTLYLGVRKFDQSQVPFKSRCGNQLTIMAFRLSAGYKISDTQTGLRGIPQTHLPQMLQIKGQRFEYEMNMLMQVQQLGLKIEEIPIETIYFGKNEHSHFRVVQDSLLVYGFFLKFIASSLCSALIDIAIFYLLFRFILPISKEKLLVSTVIARVGSGFVNYLMNKYVVFESTTSKTMAEAKNYFLLFISQLVVSYLLVQSLLHIFTQVVFLKVIVDVFLFFLSFYLQRYYIFRRKEEQVI